MNLVTETLPESDIKSQQIVMETEKNERLQRVIKILNRGWPRCECGQYYDIRAELQ